MTVRSYSTTPAANNAAPPNGAPEGMLPSAVNNTLRQVMADVRGTFEDLPFFDYGHTPTRIDNDTFTVPTDLTALYIAGRRIKLVGASTGYAAIASSSYSVPDTTVNVTMDSGNVPNALSTVSLGPDQNTDAGGALRVDLANSTTSGKGNQLVSYRRTDEEIFKSVTPTNAFMRDIEAYRYGAIGDGSTDDYSALARAIDVASYSGGNLILEARRIYKISQPLLIPAAMRIVSRGFAGPRTYANPATFYGGSEIIFTGSVSDPYDPNSFSIKIDVGSVGSEGFARVRLEGIGISWTDKDAGGVYIEGAVDVGINDCWFNGGLDNWTLGNQTGFGIYTKDAIISHFERNTFFYLGFGIVGENYWNENVIRRCNFQNVKDTCVIIRGKNVTSIRGSINENNFINAKYGVQIQGDSKSMEVVSNTFEIVSHGPVVVGGTDYLDSSSNGTPSDTHVSRNTFIACNGGIAGPAINMQSTGGTVIGNTLHNPAGSTTALVNVNSASSNISITGNDPSTAALFSGDQTKCAILDAQLYRRMPLDSSEATKSGFGSGDSGAVWWHSTKKTLRLWDDSRAVNIITGETITKTDGDTTPSVQGISGLLCNDTADRVLTAFNNGYEGQTLGVYNQSTHNLTITHGSGIALTGSANYVMTQNHFIQFLRISGTWVECGRRTP